jgi:hypothetical protein
LLKKCPAFAQTFPAAFTVKLAHGVREIAFLPTGDDIARQATQLAQPILPIQRALVGVVVLDLEHVEFDVLVVELVDQERQHVEVGVLLTVGALGERAGRLPIRANQNGLHGFGSVGYR